MKLIVILICLGLERYLHIGNMLKRSQLTRMYLQGISGLLARVKLPLAYLDLAAFVLPVWLLLFMAMSLLGSAMAGLFVLIMNIVVLTLCLGPDDLHHQVSNYLSLAEKGDEAAATSQLEALLCGEVPKAANERARALTNALCVKANSRFFAIIFWYCMPLGLYCALAYRILRSLACYAQKLGLSEGVTQANALVVSLVDWVPARLCALFYGLVGNFGQTFTYWLGSLKPQLGSHDTLLQTSGRLALELPEGAQASDLSENRVALDMVDRVLVLVLVLITVFTIGSWVS